MKVCRTDRRQRGAKSGIVGTAWAGVNPKNRRQWRAVSDWTESAV